MEICRLEKVKKTYDTGEKITPIEQVSININSGDFLCIEGSSGIGKSTLLYIMGCLTKISSGQIYIDGNKINSLGDKEITEIRRNKIGYIFQDCNLIQALSVKENIAFSQSLSGKTKNQELVDYYLDKLGLFERRDYLPCEISGGQRRRTMVACALIKNPILILADEPTNDLDEYWAGEVMKLLYDCVDSGKAVVMVTHNSHFAEKVPLRYNLINGMLYKK